MRARFFILSFVVSLACFLALAPGGAPARAAQPGPAAPQGKPVVHTGDAGPFAGGASAQMRFGDSHFSLEPSAPCEVWGIIGTDTTWSPSQCDPYIVTGNLSVQSGATLTIQPGTTVKFDSTRFLAVAGTLVARGTTESPITFTSNQSSPAAGDWGYIYFADASTNATFDGDGNYTGGSIIQYAVIEYAGGASVSCSGVLYIEAALCIEASSPLIDHNTIENSQHNGIFIWSNGIPRIRGNTITHNAGAGIYVRDSSPTIQGNTITDHSGSGIYASSSDVTISGNTIIYNSDSGIDVREGESTISDNVVSHNTAPSYGVKQYGGGVYLYLRSSDPVTISCNTISSNSAPYGGGIYIWSGSPSITNTIINNNIIINNTATHADANRGGGIYLGNGSFPLINNNDLYGNIAGNPANVPNDLYNGNKYGPPDVNADNNYWGTTDPAVIEEHIWHCLDDSSRGCVDFDPLRDSPVSSCTPAPILTPTLYAISNPEGDGNYTVDWSDVTGALTYTLYEDNNAGFTSPATRYAGSASQYAISGQATGTWYYRVKAANASGESGWSNVRSTTVVPPSTGDIYEPDDTCGQPSVLVADGTVQQHTFHDYADEDWAHFTVTSGITYVVQATSTGSGADLMLELYDACDGSLLDSDDNALGADARLIFAVPSSGVYYVKALNHDPSVSGPDVTYELLVRTQSQAGIAIIVAGRKYGSEGLQANINYVANQAFRVFKDGGIPPDDIYYLHHDTTQDADGDGHPDVDTTATTSTLQYAITTWAVSRAGPGTPLYLYLVDHGTNDLFLIDGYGDAVTPGQLDGWLNTLEDSTGCQVNVIIESCRSGSFIAAPAEISKPGRVIVTSAASDQSAHAYSDGQGAYFSNHFLSLLGDNADLWTSYSQTRASLERTGLGQTPWLDDNGDAVSNEQDGAIARQRGLISPTLEAIPWIASVSAPVQIDGYSAAITATVYEDKPPALVWAEIIAPSYHVPGGGDEMVYINVPRILLSDGDRDSTYEGTYGGFTEIGEYRVVVYARDVDGNQGLPKSTTVRTGWQVYLPMVMR